MQNQHHNQQQQFQRQRGSRQSLTSKELYGRCECQDIVIDEFDRCIYCNKRPGYLLPNELNSQGNPANDYDQNPSPGIPMYMDNYQIQHPPPPPPVREQPQPNTIWFYNRNEPYYEFTNFKEGFPIKAAIRSDSPLKLWATSEHLFQAAKFKDTNPEIADKIRMCRSARDALNMARQYREYMDPSWTSINVDVMRWVVKLKFEQYPVLAKRLLGTGDQMLVEHTEVDKFWGDGGDGSGRNMLGEVLMQVRKELRDNPLYLNNNEEEANSIYFMSDPASSSTSSFHQQPQQPPPPLPPRRAEKRDKGDLEQIVRKHHMKQTQHNKNELPPLPHEENGQLQLQQMQQQQYFQPMQPNSGYMMTEDGSIYYICNNDNM